jgi:hypothetical protein
MLAVVVALLGFALAAFFLVYGVKAGIFERHIRADSHGHYDTVRAAITRGIFYVVIGGLFLAGAAVLLVSLLRQK